MLTLMGELTAGIRKAPCMGIDSFTPLPCELEASTEARTSQEASVSVLLSLVDIYFVFYYVMVFPDERASTVEARRTGKGSGSRGEFIHALCIQVKSFNSPSIPFQGDGSIGFLHN